MSKVSPSKVAAAALAMAALATPFDAEAGRNSGSWLRDGLGAASRFVRTEALRSVDGQELVDGQPDAVLELARGYGAAELTADDDGMPMIDGEVHGAMYTIYFHDCVENRGCDSIEFVAGWDVEPGFTNGEANRWNDGHRFGHVELDDERDPWLVMDVALNHGVTVQNLDDTIDWWAVVVGEFIDYVSER